MILILILSGLQSVSEPAERATVECRTLAQADDRSIIQVGFDCPVDAPEADGLQAYADQVAAQFGLPLNITRLRIGNVVRTVRFALTEDGWRLLEPAQFLQSPPGYVGTAIERGLDARCDIRFEVSADGAPRNIEAACQAFRSNGETARQRGFAREAEEAVERSRWFAPLGADGLCVTTNFTFQLDGGTDDRPHLERPVEGAPQCP